jgi:hypothetical protein
VDHSVGVGADGAHREHAGVWSCRNASCT